jgi:hypothetical protein
MSEVDDLFAYLAALDQEHLRLRTAAIDAGRPPAARRPRQPARRGC